MEMKNCGVCVVAAILSIIGALNWGLVGVFNFDLVAKIFGEMSLVSRVVYVLVGISGIVLLVGLLGLCPKCKKSGSC